MADSTDTFHGVENGVRPTAKARSHRQENSTTEVARGPRLILGSGKKAPKVKTSKVKASVKILTKEQRHEAGKALRIQCPRTSHGEIVLGQGSDRDVIELIDAQNKDRLQNLVPIRHGRMVQSAFAYFRGTAAVQAYDLAGTPTSGIIVQACGDCHLMNFGGFATPERNLVFDINDFDETLPAPFEWDLKRLAASFAIAARWRGFNREPGARNGGPDRCLPTASR